MNDFDLDSKLKAARVPEREEDYWEMFPAGVLAKARTMRVERVQRSWRPRLAWGSGGAFAFLIVALSLHPGAGHPQITVCHALMENVKLFQAELAQFPESVRNVMQIDHGLHALIEDQP